MISLKNTLEAIGTKISQLSAMKLQTINRGTISLPYTCPYDSATIVCHCDPTQSTNYIYLRKSGESSTYMYGNSSGNTPRFSFVIPMCKNETLNQDYIYGIGTIVYEVFEHKIVGGVLRSILNRKAIRCAL